MYIRDVCSIAAWVIKVFQKHSVEGKWSVQFSGYSCCLHTKYKGNAENWITPNGDLPCFINKAKAEAASAALTDDKIQMLFYLLIFSLIKEKSPEGNWQW